MNQYHHHAIGRISLPFCVKRFVTQNMLSYSYSVMVRLVSQVTSYSIFFVWAYYNEHISILLHLTSRPFQKKQPVGTSLANTRRSILGCRVGSLFLCAGSLHHHSGPGRRQHYGAGVLRPHRPPPAQQGQGLHRLHQPGGLLQVTPPHAPLLSSVAQPALDCMNGSGYILV